MDQSAHIDEAGNDSESWLDCADDLITSRDTLCSCREEAESKVPKSGVRVLPAESSSYWVELMLVGFAIENLLKSLWLAKGGKLYEAGKLKPWGLKAKFHDLPAIANHVGWDLLEGEKHDLGMLSRIMTGAGRYPFERDTTVFPHLEGWSNISDDRMCGFVKRLRNEIRKIQRS